MHAFQILTKSWGIKIPQTSSLSLSATPPLRNSLSQRRHELHLRSITSYTSLSLCSLIPGLSTPHWSTPSPLPFPHFFLFNHFLHFFLIVYCTIFFILIKEFSIFRIHAIEHHQASFFLWLGFLVCVLSLINFGEGSVNGYSTYLFVRMIYCLVMQCGV